MRVITGEWRGFKLAALPGDATRPTTDRVKESIFNIIQFDIEGRRTLDLFAGNGQLGIEALSRGASDCTFVDNSRAAAEILTQNLTKVRAGTRGKVVIRDALAFLQTQTQPYALIFLDPPYESTYIRKALAAIDERGLLQPGGVIVCESALHDSWAEPASLAQARTEYKYGKTKVTVYRNNASTAAQAIDGEASL